MQKESTKFQSSNVFEGMTSIRALIEAMDRGVSDRRIESILLDVDKKQKNLKTIGYLKAVSEKYGFDIEELSHDDIEKIALGQSHGGILCRASERHIPHFCESDIVENGFYCMMEGIEDPYNFGYSLRSLYATGCQGILLPMRNWMSAAGVVCRSSAGASELFPMWEGDALEIVRAFCSATVWPNGLFNSFLP